MRELLSIEDVLVMHPSFTRQFVTANLGDAEFFHRDDKKITAFWTDERVESFLFSSATEEYVGHWEETHLPWVRFAESVSLVLDVDSLLSRQILEFRKSTKQIRKNRWFPLWYTNEVRHQLSNYESVLEEVPEESIQFIRPTLHSRISRLAEEALPSVEDLVTVFQEAGQDPRWMFTDVQDGLCEFTSWSTASAS